MEFGQVWEHVRSTRVTRRGVVNVVVFVVIVHLMGSAQTNEIISVEVDLLRISNWKRASGHTLLLRELDAQVIRRRWK